MSRWVAVAVMLALVGCDDSDEGAAPAADSSQPGSDTDTAGGSADALAGDAGAAASDGGVTADGDSLGGGGTGADAAAVDGGGTEDVGSGGTGDTGACAPACGDKKCGDDGCGGSCGTCGIDESCSDEGVCVAACPEGAVGCTCSADGGCDGDLVCAAGTCKAGLDCSALTHGCTVGVPDELEETCVTVPAPDGTACTPILSCTGVCQQGVCGCDCSDGVAVTLALSLQGKFDFSGTLEGVFEVAGNKTDDPAYYGSPMEAGPLACGSAWLSGDDVIEAAKTAPTEITWRRPCTPDSSVWQYFSIYESFASVWDAKWNGGLAEGTLGFEASGGDEIASLALSNVRPVSYVPPFGECQTIETIRFRVNDGLQDGWYAEIPGVSLDARYRRVRVWRDDVAGPWLEKPSDVMQDFLQPCPFGGCTSQKIELENPCTDPGMRAEFGSSALNEWYGKFADGFEEKRDGSLIFRNSSGSEIMRLNFFGGMATTYDPGYDECTTKETIIISATNVEKG